MKSSKRRKETQATIDRWSAGKGSSPRTVNKKKYDEGWDRIWGKDLDTKGKENEM